MFQAIYSRYYSAEAYPCNSYDDAEAFLRHGSDHGELFPLGICEPATGRVWIYGAEPAGVNPGELWARALGDIQKALKLEERQLELVGLFELD